MSNLDQTSAGSGQSSGAKKQKSRWWIPVVIILGFLMTGLFVLIVGFFALFGSAFGKKEVTVKPHTVLRLHIGQVPEYAATHPLDFLTAGSRRLKFLDVLTAIKRAKEDKRIEGIYYRSGDLHAGFAKAVEIRNALLDFKKTGKFIYAFLETGNESDYFMASVADSIFMATEGLVELNGFAFAELFLKKAYQKLGIDFYVQQFEDYKSAGEPFSRTSFSEPARRNLRELLDQRYDTFINSIASARNLSEQAVAASIKRGVYTADTLCALGLIDAIRYEGDVLNMLKQKAYGASSSDSTSRKLRTVNLPTFLQASSSARKKAIHKDKEIAIIFGVGTIVTGEAENAGPLEEALLASRTFIRNLRKARENKRVKAIIIRIDSPGGAITAADAIWNEIKKTTKVKPVYASMSDVAASGGYYIAMACDTIIAHPQTITGSIGVISIIPNFSGTLNKIGASVDTVTTGSASLFLNPLLPLSDRDKRKLYTISENMYKRFVRRVADSRHKSFEETREIARGRVWTGADAFKIGLVDTLGGLQTAIQIAKRRIGVPADELVRVRFYPEPEDSFNAFIRFIRRLTFTREWNQIQNMLPREGLYWQQWSGDIKHQLLYITRLASISSREGAVVALPFLLYIK